MTPNRIKSIRIRLGIGQAELALLLNVHTMTVSKWERGILKPDRWQCAMLSVFERSKVERDIAAVLMMCGPMSALGYLFRGAET